MPMQSDTFYFKLNGGPNTIAQFSKTQYRSARITVQASSNAEHQLSEIYLMHDNKLAYIREVDLIYTTDSFVDYTATIDGNNVYLKANTTLPNTDLVIFGTLFDNPVTSSDQSIDLTKIVEISTAMTSLYPNDNVDFASTMTASLDKQQEVEDIYLHINNSIEYMQTPAFAALSAAAKNAYIDNLTDRINSTSNTLSEVVKKDTENYYDATKKLDSMTVLSGLSAGFSSSSANLASKILKPEVSSKFRKSQ